MRNDFHDSMLNLEAWCGKRGVNGPAFRRHILRRLCMASDMWCRVCRVHRNAGEMMAFSCRQRKYLDRLAPPVLSLRRWANQARRPSDALLPPHGFLKFRLMTSKTWQSSQLLHSKRRQFGMPLRKQALLPWMTSMQKMPRPMRISRTTGLVQTCERRLPPVL